MEIEQILHIFENFDQKIKLTGDKVEQFVQYQSLMKKIHDDTQKYVVVVYSQEK